jgi:hypothetical protein
MIVNPRIFRTSGRLRRRAMRSAHGAPDEPPNDDWAWLVIMVFLGLASFAAALLLCWPLGEH